MNDLPPDWLANPPDWLFGPVDTVWETFVVGAAAAYAAWLATKATEKAAKWTWNHREEIIQKLRPEPPRTIRITVTDTIGLRDGVQSTVVGGVPSDELVRTLMPVRVERTALWDVRAKVSSQRTALWNVEAPTPSFARRLEELASWYLHVS